MPPKDRFSSGTLERLRSEAAARVEGGGARHIPLDQIAPDPSQPRHNMRDADLQRLAATIRRNGVLEPISVSRAGEGAYKIVYGERRWRAASLAGLAVIPAIIIPEMPEADRLAGQIIENQHRAPLANSELSEAIERLDAAGHKNPEISEITGIPEQQIKMYRAARKLPAELASWTDVLDMRTLYELYLAWDRADGQGRGAITERLSAIDPGESLSLTEARRIIKAAAVRDEELDQTQPAPVPSVQGEAPDLQDGTRVPAPSLGMRVRTLEARIDRLMAALTRAIDLLEHKDAQQEAAELRAEMWHDGDGQDGSPA